MSKIFIVCSHTWSLYLRRGQMQALRNAGETVICGGAGGDKYEEMISDLGIPFVSLPVDRRSLNPAADLKLFWALYRWYRRERPDVVHHCHIKPVIYGSIAARLARVPRIINTVTGLGYVFMDETAGWLRRLVEMEYRVALGAADYTFFQNPDDRQLFLQNRITSASKTGLLPGSGVNTTHFMPRLRMETDTPSSPVVFLMIARLLRDKGLYEYVEAARLLKAKYPHAEFHLLGPRDDENPSAVPPEDLESWLRDKRVHWLGEVSDVRDAINQADVVVLPSYREGTPRCLLEAASMGKPVITTDAVGCRETVDHGVTGLLVPLRDANALANAMEAMLNDPEGRKRMGASGRQKMVREFEEKDVVSKVIARYKAA